MINMSAIDEYIIEIKSKYETGHAREHAYRPALEKLLSSFDDVNAINDPKQSDFGAPDFVFLKKSNSKIIKGYAEAKDIGANLDKEEKSEQMQRYHGYANLFLTDYLDFRFFRNGEKYETISLGQIKDGKLLLTPENGERLAREMTAFLEQTPEIIKNGKRLAQIMGGKARRIRDSVYEIITETKESRRGAGTTGRESLLKIYELMKRMLVHDLSEMQFADMYAQTLVYGLFVARYSDDTPADFSRAEARDLVPSSNPFLRHFFDHIVGPDFLDKLGWIVDELCEVFRVSDVAMIVHKHLRITGEGGDSKDPIIHFYEDFLQEYDPAERKAMGAYYTPTPVVRYIVRQVDRILKDDFGLTKGLASTETVQYQVETGQDLRHDRRTKVTTHQTLTVPRVQVLDPAVGTATFLNETIKFIYEGFKGQEGRWPSYVNDNLLKRLHGFELMMAPYTIAHLKLGMTLKETGVDKLNERLGVYLTNTLEEGVPQQPDLFSFGLAEAVSEESRLAAEVKSERPVMVVMGNPPYSVSSNNKSKFIEKLVADYKKDLNERNIQPLSDDYIKFIRFAEDMIAKNGSGIVAMITNNSYIDGLIHRQMRKHLLQTFDKIYVLDLHGNSKKKEVAPDGSKDQNVFDIMQGVGIILAVKTGKKLDDELGDMHHAEIFGDRKDKFNTLDDDKPEFESVSLGAPDYYFMPKDIKVQVEYQSCIKIDSLMQNLTSGVVGGRDSLNVQFHDNFSEKINDFRSLTEKELVEKYALVDSRDWTVKNSIADIKNSNPVKYCLAYKPLDHRYSIYTGRSKGFVQYPRQSFWHHYQHDNYGINLMRKIIPNDNFSQVFMSSAIIDKNYYGFQSYCFPLYFYHPDGTRTANFAPAELSALTRQLTADYEPEDILDYIYAVLHSPSYRAKYKEFLKIDFPRVPAPTQDEFDRLVPLGRELRQLHLMKSPVVDDYLTTYPVQGSDEVEKITFVADATSVVGDAISSVMGKVYINGTQYFGGVPEVAWTFYIGGYQPAQKWLKDRKGRTLTADDLNHYQRIIKVLSETDRVMKEIDLAWKV